MISLLSNNWCGSSEIGWFMGYYLLELNYQRSISSRDFRRPFMTRSVSDLSSALLFSIVLNIYLQVSTEINGSEIACAVMFETSTSDLSICYSSFLEISFSISTSLLEMSSLWKVLSLKKSCCISSEKRSSLLNLWSDSNLCVAWSVILVTSKM